MRKLALKPRPTHPTQWNVHLSNVTQSLNNGECTKDRNRTELKRVLEKNRSRRGFLKAVNRLLGQLGSQKIVKLLGNAAYEAKDKLYL